MADEKVDIVVELAGADKAAGELTKVADALDKASNKAAEATPRVAGVGEGLEHADAKARSASASLGDMAQKQMLASQKSIEFTQKLSGAANAVGSLSAQLGVRGGAAGLIGSLTGAAAQGAQLGAIFGPAGALVGGIAGAAIPVIAQLSASMRQAEVDTKKLVETVIQGSEKFGELLQRIQASDTARRQAGSIQGGLASEQEQRADLQSAQGGVDRADALLRGLRVSRGQAGNNRDALAENTNMRIEVQAQREAAVEQLRLAQERYDLAAQNRAEERLARQAVRESDRDHAAATTAARGRAVGGASRPGMGNVEQFGREEDSSLAEALARGAEERLQQAEGIKEIRQLETDKHNDQMEQLAALSAARDAESERDVERLREETERTRAAWDEVSADTAQTGIGLAQSLGGAFSDAFQQAIAGQADFGKAFEQGAKKILMQFGTQMVVEGIAALLTAVGSIGAPPIAAAKAAEGAGKIALGVGLGAAGAAIPSASSTPASPTPSKGSDSGGGGNMTTVINWNSPTVMAGTTQQVGREILSATRAANSRFGSAA